MASILRMAARSDLRSCRGETCLARERATIPGRMYPAPTTGATGEYRHGRVRHAPEEPPLPADGGSARGRASGRGRLAVRAQVGRVSGRAREPVREGQPLEQERAAAAALLPRARRPRGAAAEALGHRRRDRRRAGRRPRLRHPPDAPSPGREPDQAAVGGEPGRVRRLRRPRLGGRGRAQAPARGAPPARRAAPVRHLPRDDRPQGREAVARPARGGRVRRRRGEAARLARTCRARGRRSSR